MNGLKNQSRRSFLVQSGIVAGAGIVSSISSSRARAQISPLITKAGSTTLLPQFRGFGRQAEDSDAFWAQVRASFFVKPNLIFLNNGTLGPSPDFVLRTRQHYSELLAADPTDCFRSKELAEVRALLAARLNAASDEITITHSTTEGMNIFAHGLDWKAGDEVIVGDQEHFGATEPYQALARRYGIKIVTAKLPTPALDVDQVVSTYARAFTPRTHVLVVSHVSYISGLVVPLRELADLAHRNGALISVDGAQSFGVLGVDVRATNIDHFAGSGQKWLLAGTGTGVNYIRKDLQPSVWPLYGFDDPGQKTSPRYERSGQLGIPAAIGIAAALQFQDAIGPQLIENRARTLGERVRKSVGAIPGAQLIGSSHTALAGNINTFTLKNLPAAQVAKSLSQREGIVIRTVAYGDQGALRVSTHFYNRPEEVDQLFAILAKWSKDPTLLVPTSKNDA